MSRCHNLLTFATRRHITMAIYSSQLSFWSLTVPKSYFCSEKRKKSVNETCLSTLLIFVFSHCCDFFFKNNHFLNLFGVKWPQNEAIHLSAFEPVFLHKAFSNTYLNTVISYFPSLHYHYVYFLVLVLCGTCLSL